MRTGSLVIQLAALATLGLAQVDLFAQRNGANYQSPQNYPASAASRPIQALFLAPMGMGQSNPYVDAYGNPVVVPAGYCCDSCPDDGGCYGDPSMCSQGGCDGCSAGCNGNPPGYIGGCCINPGPPFCNGSTCPQTVAGTIPPFGDGVDSLSYLPPYRTEQCGPHYFDVRMEAVFLTRDETFNQSVDFTSLNVAGPIVLSSRQLDLEVATGFRILGRYDIAPLAVIEFGYTGIENLDSSASFTDPNPVDADTGNLYSLFSDFVRDPAALPPDVTTPGGSLPQTERAITQAIHLETELHTGEFTYRRYWVGFNPTVSGTLLAGFRFTRLREDFDFTSIGEATGQYLEVAKNDLAGFQAGGDMWIHLRQGCRAGIECKAGIYDNHYTLDNTFGTVTTPASAPLINDHFEKDIPAFISEASADLVADVLPSWSIRAGYEILYINSVVLAGENFNTGTVYNSNPQVLLPERVPFIFDQGHALYHGLHVGAEYTW